MRALVPPVSCHCETGECVGLRILDLSPCHAMQSLRGGVLNIVGMQQLTHHLYLDGEIYNHMNLVESTAWLASIPVCVARQPRYNIYC